MKTNATLLAVLAQLNLLCIGCDPQGKHAQVPVTIMSVRITEEGSQPKNAEGSPAQGAFLGAMIAGPSGAVVGAEMSRDDVPNKVSFNQVTGCRFVAKIDDTTQVAFTGTRTSSFSFPDGIQCSLLRPGDRIYLLKQTLFGEDSFWWIGNKAEFLPKD